MKVPTLCHQDYRSVGSSYSIECVLHHNVDSSKTAVKINIYDFGN